MFCVYSVTNTSDSYQAEQYRENRTKIRITSGDLWTCNLA